MATTLEFKISYNGGLAEDGKLNIYDAAESLRGLSRALAITTHAFINKEDVRTRADRVHGAEIYLHGPQRGSFTEIVSVALENPVASTIGLSVVSSAFYDFMKWTWSAALGQAPHQPATHYVRSYTDRQEPFLGEISSGLEPALHDLHRPIHRDRPMTISVLRPRVGEILRLDDASMAYVTVTPAPELVVDLLGNVTKYNRLSGFGRLFSDDEQRTVPFSLDPRLTGRERARLTWSMHQPSRGFDGKLLLDVQRFFTARGDLKRYVITKVRRAPA
ncbi:hypothetical protein GCM10007242_44860 [Pigmentiphaga litoralis]|uniref:DUF7946 domain-containing protein n=1 Tax=Pigmentiphaga litoralis TaxID=516702 RepID=UPI0016745578|nr:hypothetical protein [Pigmentiphaga litoralis]GGX32886.1 hypothetical protein GCM10007242_44860 [Pigmentiphaga litoralis]